MNRFRLITTATFSPPTQLNTPLTLSALKPALNTKMDIVRIPWSTGHYSLPLKEPEAQTFSQKYAPSLICHLNQY